MADIENKNNVKYHRYSTFGFTIFAVAIGAIGLYLFLHYNTSIQEYKDLFKNTKFDSKDDVTVILQSFATSLNAYYNTLCVFFGLFSLLAIGIGFLGWKGGHIVDKINLEYNEVQNISEKIRDKHNQVTDELKSFDSDIQEITFLAEMQSIYSNMNKIDRLDAINRCEIITQYNKNSFNGFFSLGLLHLENNEFEKAIDKLKEAQRIVPTNISIKFHLGTCYLNKVVTERNVLSVVEKRELLAAAMDYFDTVYNHNKRDVRARNSYGSCLLLLGEATTHTHYYDEAKEVFDGIIKKDKNYYRAIDNMGCAHYKLKDYDKAIAYFDESDQLTDIKCNYNTLCVYATQYSECNSTEKKSELEKNFYDRLALCDDGQGHDEFNVSKKFMKTDPDFKCFSETPKFDEQLNRIFDKKNSFNYRTAGVFVANNTNFFI